MKKWIIAAALVVVVWLGAFACTKKPAPVVQAPVAIERTVEQPYTVTKTDPKVQIKRSVKHKTKRHVEHKDDDTVKCPYKSVLGIPNTQRCP